VQRERLVNLGLRVHVAQRGGRYSHVSWARFEHMAIGKINSTFEYAVGGDVIKKIYADNGNGARGFTEVNYRF
jgi:hypothetical protein